MFANMSLQTNARAIVTVATGTDLTSFVDLRLRPADEVRARRDSTAGALSRHSYHPGQAQHKYIASLDDLLAELGTTLYYDSEQQLLSRTSCHC